MKNPSLIVACLALLAISGQSMAMHERSEAAKDAFKSSNPCPTNGHNYGPCPGYVIDHIQALACGGADAPANMQWQTKAAGKSKDKWERKGCSTSESHIQPVSFEVPQETAQDGYITGPRGGCYTMASGGNKRYVAHSFCGR